MLYDRVDDRCRPFGAGCLGVAIAPTAVVDVVAAAAAAVVVAAAVVTTTAAAAAAAAAATAAAAGVAAHGRRKLALDDIVGLLRERRFQRTVILGLLACNITRRLIR